MPFKSSFEKGISSGPGFSMISFELAIGVGLLFCSLYLERGSLWPVRLQSSGFAFPEPLTALPKQLYIGRKQNV